ncbi:hypothetical protein JKP88DRAFT_353734 [Tribonema minus]|uniref:Uncharacterized protein n=1 Tax=Tribonema minus TaxID=303371 RepID=A0A835Z570_9STRA|nr:hypothetical protein JKP88DRAFT_353734 [Tribonema minus]
MAATVAAPAGEGEGGIDNDDDDDAAGRAAVALARALLPLYAGQEAVLSAEAAAALAPVLPAACASSHADLLLTRQSRYSGAGAGAGTARVLLGPLARALLGAGAHAPLATALAALSSPWTHTHVSSLARLGLEIFILHALAEADLRALPTGALLPPFSPLDVLGALGGEGHAVADRIARKLGVVGSSGTSQRGAVADASPTGSSAAYLSARCALSTAAADADPAFAALELISPWREDSESVSRLNGALAEELAKVYLWALAAAPPPPPPLPSTAAAGAATASPAADTAIQTSLLSADTQRDNSGHGALMQWARLLAHCLCGVDLGGGGNGGGGSGGGSSSSGGGGSAAAAACLQRLLQLPAAALGALAPTTGSSGAPHCSLHDFALVAVRAVALGAGDAPERGVAHICAALNSTAAARQNTTGGGGSGGDTASSSIDGEGGTGGHRSDRDMWTPLLLDYMGFACGAGAARWRRAIGCLPDCGPAGVGAQDAALQHVAATLPATTYLQALPERTTLERCLASMELSVAALAAAAPP